MMVSFLAISILLLPIATASSDDFWDDVDIIYNDLSNPEGLQTQATTRPMQDVSQHSLLSDEIEENASNTQERGKYFPKYVTLCAADIDKFKKKLIIKNDSQDIPLAIIEDKLLALGKTHEWKDMHTYQVEKYQKYWAKVCVTFWDTLLENGQRICCIVSRSYASNRKRLLSIRGTKQHLDILGCRCHIYLTNCKNPLSTPETFLIHKGIKNEFFIFKESESENDKLSIKGFKYGITLPNPSVLDRSKNSSTKFKQKQVSLRPYEIIMFREAISNTSTTQNVSLEQLNDKIMKFDEIHEWPDLFKYDYDKYTRYWAKVCVLFWGKQLDSTHYQICYLSPSLGVNRVRKLFLPDRIQHFDLLFCKCHSYITNYRIPASSVDTFLIHQSSANEFFIFEQHATLYCQSTLCIKDFKGGITLPNPDDFN